MKQEDLTVVLQDFAKRVEYVRENTLPEEKGAHKHLKEAFDAKEALLKAVHRNVEAILDCFKGINEIDEIIHKEDKKAHKFSEDELSKYDKA